MQQNEDQMKVKFDCNCSTCRRHKADRRLVIEQGFAFAFCLCVVIYCILWG